MTTVGPATQRTATLAGPGDGTSAAATIELSPATAWRRASGRGPAVGAPSLVSAQLHAERCRTSGGDIFRLGSRPCVLDNPAATLSRSR